MTPTFISRLAKSTVAFRHPVLLLLVVGAMLNIGTAWACICSAPTSWVTYGGGGLSWPQRPPNHWPAPTATISRGGFGWGCVAASHQSLIGKQVAEAVPGEYMEFYRAGWPCASLAALRQLELPSDLDPKRIVNEWDGRLSRATNQRPLPARPLWSGFLANTLLYALVSYVVWRATRRLYLWRNSRLARGLCPSCGYPAGSSARCSECGEAHTIVVGAKETPPSVGDAPQHS
jgi:hypothetical protein